MNNLAFIFASSNNGFVEMLEKGYSVVGIIAIFIHIIVNFDVIFRKASRTFPGGKFYLLFLMGVLAFHLADGLWGVFSDNKLPNALFVDTSIYFVGMGVSILFWGIFVSLYIGKESKFVKVILLIGYVVFGIQIIALIVNIFVPILFQITKETEYIPLPIRYVTLTLQIIMFVLIAIYTISVAIGNKGCSKRRHIAIFSFCIAMSVFLTLQVFFPLLPLYSLGYLIGVTVLHTFVFEDQKVEKQKELEEAKNQIQIDALTGVKSKHAYVDREEVIDKLINKGEMNPFALVVFDLNDLKLVNDTYGHEAGDLYIVAATKLIVSIFSQSEIYRIGGDEFVALLEGESYHNREALHKQFKDVIDQNLKLRKSVIVSSGLSAYHEGQDNTFIQVFNRADEEMYQRKHEIKEGISKK